MQDPVSILSGLKVIDCGTFIFGPAATTVLSDFGADVIKIEPPGIGDPYRYLQKMPPLPDAEHAYGWLLTNRNKRGIVLNLKDEEGQAVLRRLVAGADVFVTNYHPSVLRAFRATYEELGAAQLAPRLCPGDRLRRARRGSREARLRCDRVVGAQRADGTGARGRLGPGPVDAREWATILRR